MASPRAALVGLWCHDGVMSEGDISGPVLPLYLNLAETRVLALAVGMLAHFDQAVVHDAELSASADERDMARADQVRAAARERAAILASLSTALAEHATSLELSGELDAAEEAMEVWDVFKPGRDEAAP